MKYESELINEILEQRGHEFPDLHYQSECVETWIKEYRGAYPKLCDYESEWLNYIIENPIGEFPYETVTTNNTATINNVVPFEYKSAILKGQTLVNKMVNAIYRGNPNDLRPNSNMEFINTSGLARNILPMATSVFEPNKTYTIILFLDEIEDGGLDMTHTFAGKNATLKIGANKTLYTTPSRLDDNNYSHNTQIQCNFKARYMVLDGDYTNVDIPYFTDMQSVKMPVLTTTGKNLFDGMLLSQWCSTTGSISDNVNARTIKMEVEPNTKYTVSRTEKGNRLDVIMFSQEPILGNNTIVGTALNATSNTDTTTFTTTSETHWVIIRAIDNVANYTESVEFQIEFGNRTPHEPYKSNILTVNEDVTLRSNGNVYDELNLLTGRLTQRIDENNEVLSQEVIKTVELTVVNQNGDTLSKIKPIEGTMHINVSGTPLNPTAILEVPVEAITQNLASFIETEE